MSAQQQLSQPSSNPGAQKIASLQQLVRRLHRNNQVAQGVLWGIAIIVTMIFVSIILRLLIQGFPSLINPRFYAPTGEASVGAQIFNTFYILILAEIILIPISLAAAIFLTEYAPQGRTVASIHFAAETLAGVPSIVLGLFGYALFCTFFGFGLSRIAGALTLLCLNFPNTLRLFEDALTSVSHELREGGLALGCTRWRVVHTIVLPSALSGIVTGIVLSAGKIIGEAAALIFTMGASNPANVFTLSPFIGSDNLTINIYNIQSTGGGLTRAVADAVTSGSSALLIIILLLINLGARSAGNAIQRRVTGA
ncbi:phosphate ABC transporter permease PstA [Dictyobacter formicarum]|uniref:Phosphate transport system permease protein PstA n=1 Tax=Dictyobacter formicarum TaxID=2778368 RepID=A0ABQ3VKS8_9CHLR|nr:phosphate ABC transporter permease PstA [Dictyobacter formicarum]GHO86512.1 phosphate transport system permease protein PstA [Dictyobacter formicarum]